MNCGTVQASLTEYIERTLEPAQHGAIDAHLTTCASCRSVHAELQSLLADTKSLSVPDPGPNFWQEFPDATLNRYKLEQSRHAKANATPNWSERLTAWWREWTWVQMAVPAAAVAAVVAGVCISLFLPPETSLNFDSAAFQARIADGATLARLTKANPSSLSQGSSYGFASRADRVNFFRVGALYAETLALARDDRPEALTRLDTVAQSLGVDASRAAPAGLAEARRTLADPAVPPAETLEILSRLQTAVESNAREQDTNSVALFRAGAWTVNIRLAAAADQRDLLRWTAELDYLRTELQRAQAPRGALEALDELKTIFNKPELSASDASKVRELAARVQSVLG